jgi:hypothetical protein
MANVDCGRLLFDTLAVDFRVTLYEPRGGSMEGGAPADMADDLRGLQEKLGLSPSLLVGRRLGAVAALHAAVLYPDIVAGLVLSEPCLPGAREQDLGGLTARRLLPIEQPVVLLCGEHSPCRSACRFLEANLSHCRTAFPGDDCPALVESIRKHLIEMAKGSVQSDSPARPRTDRPRGRGWWARIQPENGDGRAVSRWMARVSAWMS